MPESGNMNEEEFSCSSPEIPDQTPNGGLSCGYHSRRQLFSSDGGANSQLQILQEIRTSIGNLSNQMDAIEDKLTSVEQQQKEALSTTTSSPSTRKVSARIRVSWNF